MGREVIASGSSFTEETYIPGSRRKKWGIITKTPIINSAGNVSGIVGTIIDITERRKEELRLILLEDALENIKHGIVIVDTSKKNDYRIKYVNKTLTHWSGHTKKHIYRKQMVAKELLESFHIFDGINNHNAKNKYPANSKYKFLKKKRRGNNCNRNCI
jgi:hypothetical protein